MFGSFREPPHDVVGRIGAAGHDKPMSADRLVNEVADQCRAALHQVHKVAHCIYADGV